MATALIIVDVQNDFCEGGSLAVAGGAAVAAGIAGLLAGGTAAAGFDHVVATQDWHIDPGAHFADEPDYVDSWPVHCVAGTAGAALHPNLDPILPLVEAFVRKGRYAPAYSGFEGLALTPAEAGSTVSGGNTASGAPTEPGPHDAPPGVPLGAWLRERGVDAVTVVGIATDYCVRASALDAAAAGFTVTLPPALTAAVHPGNTPSVLAELAAAGITVVGSDGEERSAP